MLVWLREATDEDVALLLRASGSALAWEVGDRRADSFYSPPGAAAAGEQEEEWNGQPSSYDGNDCTYPHGAATSAAKSASTWLPRIACDALRPRIA